MTSKFLVLLGAVAAFNLFGAGEPTLAVNWDPDGTGGWGDATRWKEGYVPGVTNRVNFTDAKDVVIRDADLDVFTNVLWYSFTRSVITVDCTKDVQYPGCVRWGQASKFVKLGENKFEFTRPTDCCSYCVMDFIVSNGWLTIGHTYEYEKLFPAVEVWKPGILELGGSATTHNYVGIAGDGVVTNTSSGRRVICLRTKETNGTLGYGPWTFSGTLGGNIRLKAGVDAANTPTGWCEQNFLGTGSERSAVASDYNDMFNGLFGIEHFGWGAPSPASVRAHSFHINGANNVSDNDEVGVVYLGTGETTDVGIQIYNRYGKSQTVIDGGPHGGLVLADRDSSLTDSGLIKNVAEYYYFGCSWATAKYTWVTSERVVLRGSNTEPCVISNRVDEETYTDICFIKQGSGTWRFVDNDVRENRGPILVEQGALEFTSFAALGKATSLYTNFWATAQEDKAACKVDYSYRLGDGRTDWTLSDLATMRYVGATSMGNTSRHFAVNGAGRLAVGEGAGSLAMNGVFSDVAGANTIVFDGAGNGTATDVTDGVGTLGAVKTGAGTWTLAGAVELTGGVDVREGTLKIASDTSAAAISTVALAGSGQFISERPVAVSSLAVSADVAVGAKVSGVTFAQTGTLNITGVGSRRGVLTLPIDFEGCTDTGNLSAWSVSIDGVAKPKYSAQVTANGLEILPPGIILIFK